MHGWRFHPTTSALDSRGFLVIYFPGNAGCRADRVGDCADFTQLGFEVILFDYRGYGDNEGSPSEALLAADAKLVWSFATSELHFPAERIFFFGESLGGAVAIRLAAECSAAGNPPAALVLNSTFASLAETAAWHYPAFPLQYVLLDRYPSVARIALVTCPILQFHGTADQTVPFEQGRRLFDAAPAKSSNGMEKVFVEVPGGPAHNFITMSDMQSAVRKLLARLE